MKDLVTIAKLVLVLILFFGISACNKDNDVQPEMEEPTIEEPNDPDTGGNDPDTGNTDPDTGGEEPEEPTLSVLDYLADNADFSMLNAAIERADFSGELAGVSAYTFFAPNNAAMQDLLDNNGWTSVNDVSPAVWKTILKIHVSVAGQYTAEDLTHGTQITILYQDRTIHIDWSDPAVMLVVAGLTKGEIVQADQKGTDGVIHEIDKVLSF